MVLKAKAFQPKKDPIEQVEDAVPLIVPMFLWDVLVKLSEVENCSPGEILDKAVCHYLESENGKRLDILRSKGSRLPWLEAIDGQE